MVLRLDTWNVNGIRARIDLIVLYLKIEKPDILCLQEVRCKDYQFPVDEIKRLGYHCYLNCQSGGINGVSIISRYSLSDVRTGVGINKLDEEARLISGVLWGVRIINCYVPYGTKLDHINYQKKLLWLDALNLYCSIYKGKSGTLVCGDLNIALTNLELCSQTNKEMVVKSSDVRKRLYNIMSNNFLFDTFRKFDKSRKFSCWRFNKEHLKNNWGMRLDYILTSENLYRKSISCKILKDYRFFPKPSDHVPVSIVW